MQQALNFACGETLFIIRIENNNSPNFYCRNITNLSHFKHEKEILITSNCTFHITKKEKNNKKNTVCEEIYLTCEGQKNENEEK